MTEALEARPGHPPTRHHGPAALDVWTLPLQGSRLIEASAGTGKTWTIAALVLRLVVGHGCPPRGPQEILVMTFTKAATRELASRIRERLAQAATAMRADDEPSDELLRALRQAFPVGPAREDAAWRLAMAAEAMDEASVFTIDAWCQRLLREHAFDSGSAFDETLLPDESTMRAEAVRDIWRQQVYPLPDALLGPVLARWSDVDALEDDVKPLLDQPLPDAAGHGSLAEALTAAVQQRGHRLLALKAGWTEKAAQMQAWLATIWDTPHHPARPAVPARAHATKWLQALTRWAQDPSLERPDVKTGAERLSGNALRAGLRRLGLDPEALPPVFDDFEALMGQLQTLPDPESALRLHAAAAVRARIQALKAGAGAFGFADALQRLDEALDETRHGERARRLREHIVGRYPVALIDEFQDTSPVQLRIFDRLYRVADDDPVHTLLLIGDPKQAIYSFRGADIHSYLRARSATAGRHHALTTNRRSTEPLVQAVNRLFRGAEQRPGPGAFRFRQEAGASPLPFVEVQAYGRPERLVGAEGLLPPVEMIVDASRRSKEDSRRVLGALCAERIVALLNDPAVGFEEEGQPLRCLRPGDIAVLVHHRAEADAVRAQMQRRGLASVYLSDKDSVFASDEAADLLRMMQAVDAPRDLRLARAALATSLMGLPLEELLTMAADEARLDRYTEPLRELGEAWRGRGILAMVRQMLHSFGLPARWLAGDAVTHRGERRLTNVLHLAELLQAAAPQARTPQALIAWLRQQIEDADQGPEGGEQVLRLESDADRVQVVTIHKSKGLEYPLVFLPFATHEKELARTRIEERRLALRLPGPDGEGVDRELVLSPTPAQLEAAREAQRGEALRLFYVAVTRARHALWMGVSDHPRPKSKSGTWPQSALGHLLSRSDVASVGCGEDPDETPQAHATLPVVEDVLAHASGYSDVCVEIVGGDDKIPAIALTRLRSLEVPGPLAPPPSYRAEFDRRWAVSSYSQLVREAVSAGSPGTALGGSNDPDAGPAAARTGLDTAAGAVDGGSLPSRTLRDDEPDEQDPSLAAAQPEGRDEGSRPSGGEAQAPWHRFPRGAFAGDFLHTQLEWLASEHFQLEASPDLQQRLVRRCERQGWGARADDVVAWLREVCHRPLPPLGVPLAGLQTVAPEMEFWFPSDGLSGERLDQLCRQALWPGVARAALTPRTLRGLMMGFADLVFEHEGRYWVLDYKSNRLGPRDGDYTHEAMAAAMRDHRYDVQAALYLLALHRLLRSRLGARYAPGQHLGGALYLFLRGIRGPAAGCVAWESPVALVEALDALIPARVLPEEGSPT